MVTMALDAATLAALQQQYAAKIADAAIGQVGSWDIFRPALDKQMAAAAEVLLPGRTAPVTDTAAIQAPPDADPGAAAT